MAKKKRRGRPPGSGRVTQAAETVGSTLGSVMARVDTWMAQREEIARDLRAAADSIMGSEGPMPWLRGKAQAASDAASDVVTAVKRKRRTMSAAARKAIGDAQRARWAAQKAAAAAPSTSAKRGRPAKAKKGV